MKNKHGPFALRGKNRVTIEKMRCDEQKSRYDEKIALRCENRVTMKKTRHDEENRGTTANIAL